MRHSSSSPVVFLDYCILRQVQACQEVPSRYYRAIIRGGAAAASQPMDLCPVRPHTRHARRGVAPAGVRPDARDLRPRLHSSLNDLALIERYSRRCGPCGAAAPRRLVVCRRAHRTHGTRGGGWGSARPRPPRCLPSVCFAVFDEKSGEKKRALWLASIMPPWAVV